MLDKVSKGKTPAKQKPVTVESKLRKAAAHKWFDEAAAPSKAAAVKKKRDEARALGPELSSDKLKAVADELERVQQELNPLLVRKEELSRQILAHWGHTGIEEVESGLGNTRVTTSMSLGIDPAQLEEKLTPAQWSAVTRRIVQAPLLLAQALKKEEIKSLIAGTTITATNVKVSVVPPSSRTPKTGDAAEGDD